MLRLGLAAGGVGAEGEAVAEAIEARLSTGRPLAAEEWIARQEAATGRTMAPPNAAQAGVRGSLVLCPRNSAIESYSDAARIPKYSEVIIRTPENDC